MNRNIVLNWLCKIEDTYTAKYQYCLYNTPHHKYLLRCINLIQYYDVSI